MTQDPSLPPLATPTPGVTAASPPVVVRQPAMAPLTILYNGACPVCRTGISIYATADRRGACRHRWVDIVADPSALADHGLAREAVKKRLHAVDGAGRLHIGIDAFAAIWQHSPGQAWLARLVRLPGLHALLAAGYDHGLAPVLSAWNRARGR